MAVHRAVSDAAIGMKLAALMVPCVAGVAVALSGRLEAPRQAIGALNVYALRVAFPALVAVGLLRAAPLDAAAGFYLLWPLVLALSLGALTLGQRRWPESLGSLGVIASFGNVAYLGLPVVAAVMGEVALGVASWLVAIHVAMAVTLGPWWAARHGERGGASGGARGGGASQVLRQPLVLAPLLAILLKSLTNPSVTEGVAALLDPIGKSAAPVALFMLGLYLHMEREALRRRPDAALLGHVALRLVLLPGAVGLGAWGLVRLGWLDAQAMQVHVLLASMPAAITTFSIAYEYEANPRLVAATIVWSTLLAAVTTPLWFWLATRLMGG